MMKTDAEMKLDTKVLRVHPVTPLLLWIMLAILSQTAQGVLLAWISITCLTAAQLVAGQRLWMLLRRTRWLLFSLLLLYAWLTPGEQLLPDWGRLSPTGEGLMEGVMQLLRLLSLLSALAILLVKLTREQMVLALYTVLMPLQWIGVNRDRLAVRLALTLHYADQPLQLQGLDRDAIMRLLDARQQAGEIAINLERAAWGWLDLMLLGVGVLALLWGLW